MKIIKNIINKSNFIKLKNLVNSNNFNWFFLENSAHENLKNTVNHSFYHNVLINNNINSTFYDFVNSISLQIKDKFKLDDYEIFRLRFGLTTSYGKKIINDPHIDNEENHLVILLYMDNSDGDTYFYKNNKIINSISPEENKAVLFDGFTYHSSSKPFKYSKRIVLNINLKKIQNETK